MKINPNEHHRSHSLVTWLFSILEAFFAAKFAMCSHSINTGVFSGNS